MKRRKEITTNNKKVVVTFIIYAIHFIFSQGDWLTLM